MSRLFAFLRMIFFHPPNVTVFFQIFLGAFLLFAAVMKLVFPYPFLVAILRFGWLDPNWIKPVAGCIIFSEMVLGALLLTGKQLRWVAAGVIGMLSVFTCVVLIALLSGQHFSCGCWGPSYDISSKHILENMILIAMAGWIFYYPRTWWTI